MDEWVWSNGGMILTGKTEVLGEKAVPLSHVNQKYNAIYLGSNPELRLALCLQFTRSFPTSQRTHFISCHFAVTVVQLKSSQYMAAARRHVVARHRRFGRAHYFHFKDQNSNEPFWLSWLLGLAPMLFRNVGDELQRDAAQHLRRFKIWCRLKCVCGGPVPSGVWRRVAGYVFPDVSTKRTALFFRGWWVLNTSISSVYFIINIKGWAIWPVPSPQLQLLSPTFLRSSNCSLSLWIIVVCFERDSDVWHSLEL